MKDGNSVSLVLMSSSTLGNEEKFGFGIRS